MPSWSIPIASLCFFQRFMMWNLDSVFLISITLLSSTGAIPYSADSDYLENAALSSADDGALDYQFFDGQQFSYQDEQAEPSRPDDYETDNLFFQDSPGLDSFYLQAFLDETASPIDMENPEDSIYSVVISCDAPIDGESSSSSELLRARDLSNIFNLRLPDLDQKPSCRNPTYQQPQPPQPPVLQPEWVPTPLLDPVNQERCPREQDGIQPIALCCYEDDFGQLGERIAVARKCYTCGFRDSSPIKNNS